MSNNKRDASRTSSMTAEQALDVLADNMRDKDAGVIRLGIRDNDKTREAIAWLLENRAALSSPRVGRAALCVPDAFDMPEFSTINRSSLNYKAGWNACRRAMLAASPEPDVSEQQCCPNCQQGVCCTHASLCAEADSIRSENEALRKDAERHDVLSKIEEIDTLEKWAKQQGTSIISEAFRQTFLDLMARRRDVLCLRLREGA